LIILPFDWFVCLFIALYFYFDFKMVAFLISAVIATSSALGAWGVIETQKIREDSHTYRKLHQPVQNPVVSRSTETSSKNDRSQQEESSTDTSQPTGIRRRKGKDPQDTDQSATISPPETSSSTNIHSTNSTPNKTPVKVLSANISSYFEKNAEAAALYSSIISATLIFFGPLSSKLSPSMPIYVICTTSVCVSISTLFSFNLMMCSYRSAHLPLRR
jgi:hypothetical protein